MSFLIENKESIISFWNLKTDTEKENLIREIREYSESTNKEDFIKEVRENFPQTNTSGISVIYEALTYRPEKWGDFFYDEYIRCFSTAEQSSSPYQILNCLEEISMIGSKDFPQVDQLIDYLTKHLTTTIDVVRYFAIWFLGDWLWANKENLEKYESALTQVTDRLNDPHWKVRFVADSVLSDLGKLPKDYSKSFADKLRAKFQSPYMRK